MKAFHYFSGSNTAKGFRGYLDSILPPDKAKRVFIIKGGPGVGKSSLMRAVGAEMEKTCERVEYYHCSGDPDSLDAVCVPEKGLVLLDGTAPHTVDPKTPGAMDGIVNLGDCLDERELAKEKTQIEALQKDIAMQFGRAYHYLRGAEECFLDAGSVYESALDASALEAVRESLLKKVPHIKGDMRHCYAQAVTYRGVAQYLDSVEDENAVCLDLPWGVDADVILHPLYDYAVAQGFETRVYHNCMDAEKIAHLTIGSVTFTSVVMAGKQTMTLPFYQETLKRSREAITFDRAAYVLLFNQAVEALANAKALHDQLERYYVDAMDFEKWEKIKKAVLEKISLL